MEANVKNFMVEGDKNTMFFQENGQLSQRFNHIDNKEVQGKLLLILKI